MWENYMAKKPKHKGFQWLKFWEARYADGGTSGPGSSGKCAEFKAEVVNSIVKEHSIRSVIEFGCGDGNQLSLATYPTYVGLDVSQTAVELCKDRYKHDETKSIFLYEPNCFEVNHPIYKADLGLSLDVIFHLVDDKIFDLYMTHLCSTARRFVIIYSTDTDEQFQQHQAPHMRHHCFSEWIGKHCPEWRLLRKIPNKYPELSFCSFFFYENLERKSDNE